MKKLILFILGCCFYFNAIYSQLDNYYWVESSPLDSLLLADSASNILLIGRQNNTQFVFNTTSINDVYLKPKFNDCVDEISFKIWGKSEYAYTSWIYLKQGDSISIADCFQRFSEKRWPPISIASAKEKALSFWKSIAKKWRNREASQRVVCNRAPALKGDDFPAVEDPKLTFEESDCFRFLDSSDLIIPFRMYKNITIKSIYIISYDRKILLSMGDPSLVANIYKIDENKTASLGELRNQIVWEEENEIVLELSYEYLRSYFQEELESGKWYQLGIELESDESEFNPYSFDFQFITSGELMELQTFGNE